LESIERTAKFNIIVNIFQDHDDYIYLLLIISSMMVLILALVTRTTLSFIHWCRLKLDESACSTENFATTQYGIDFLQMISTTMQMKTVPFYLYAAAPPTSKARDTIRRELGKYCPNFRGIQWAGEAQPEHVPVKPDEGLEVVSRAKGIPEKSCKLMKLASKVVKMVQRFKTLTKSGPSSRGGRRPIVKRLSRNLYVPKI
ncbi:hypothetical protein H5410_059826, partial [Solanum commersonii]